MSKLKLMIVAIMVAATLSAAPVEAQVDAVTLESGMHSNPLYRRVGYGRLYGLPLNADKHQFYSPPPACLATTPWSPVPAEDHYIIPNDSRCQLRFDWTNNRAQSFSSVEASVEGGGIEVRAVVVQNNGSTVIHGRETGQVVVEVGFSPQAGNFNSVLRLTADNGQTASFDFSYQLLSTSPSYPREVATTITADSLSVTWIRPEFDGGTDITGYVVELIAPKEFNSADSSTYRTLTISQRMDANWWWARSEVCDFRGRPDLTQCDIPNNLRNEVTAGNYLVAVQALSVGDPDPGIHSDLFYTSDLALPALRLPDPEPTPLPEPEPIPPLPPVTIRDCPCPVVPYPGSFISASTIEEFVGADDYSAEDIAPVMRLYQAYFNRRPDIGGAIYWSIIRHNNLFSDEPGSLSEIAGWMADGDEFQNRYFGTTNAQFVEQIYRNMLGRPAEPAGYVYWLRLLDEDKLSRSGMVFYVTANTEFINRYPYGKDGLL